MQCPPLLDGSDDWKVTSLHWDLPSTLLAVGLSTIDRSALFYIFLHSFIYIFINQFIYLSINLFICIFIHLFMYSCIYVCIYLFISCVLQS